MAKIIVGYCIDRFAKYHLNTASQSCHYSFIYVSMITSYVITHRFYIVEQEWSSLLLSILDTRYKTFVFALVWEKLVIHYIVSVYIYIGTGVWSMMIFYFRLVLKFLKVSKNLKKCLHIIKSLKRALHILISFYRCTSYIYNFNKV